MTSDELERLIPRHFARSPRELDAGSRSLFEAFIRSLDRGDIRAAEKREGRWQVNHWVKQGILLGFRLGSVADFSVNEHFQYSDKGTYPLKDLRTSPPGIRLVPGGSSVRRGAYLGPRVTLMPPMYVNVGAWVGEGTMVDSHALVGSCAQIGANVHLSGGVGIGGVLEPPQAVPVFVGDECLIGSRCIVADGARVGEGTVLGAGCILTGSIPVIDAATGEELGRGVVPPWCVAVSGTRPRTFTGGEFGLPCVLVVKRLNPGERHDKSVLNDVLRDHGAAT